MAGRTPISYYVKATINMLMRKLKRECKRARDEHDKSLMDTLSFFLMVSDEMYGMG